MNDGLLLTFLENIEQLLDGLEAGEPIPCDILDEMQYEVVVVRTALERKWTWDATACPDSWDEEPVWEEDDALQHPRL